MKESLGRVFAYLKGSGGEEGIARAIDATEFHVTRGFVRIENRRDVPEVSGDVGERVDPVSYADPLTTAMKSPGLICPDSPSICPGLRTAIGMARLENQSRRQAVDPSPPESSTSRIDWRSRRSEATTFLNRRFSSVRSRTRAIKGRRCPSRGSPTAATPPGGGTRRSPRGS
jgi:hypothetical protein